MPLSFAGMNTPKTQIFMDKNHIVKQGECFSSIAKENGFLEKTLWEHPSNAALREKRKNPNILLPDDEIVIPYMELNEYDAATEQKHTYQLKADKVKLQLRLLREDKPRANTKYRLKIKSDVINSQTDGDGWIRTSIPATIKTAKLILMPDNSNEEEYELLIGHLDPLEENPGVAKRLDNLGFLIGSSENKDGELKSALAKFQHKNDLSKTGEGDQNTLNKLKL